MRPIRAVGAALALLTTLLVAGSVPAGAAAGAPPASLTTVTGTATWNGGPDTRGLLLVGACPADEQGPFCPSLQVTFPAGDGSYELALPFTGRSETWNVAAVALVSGVPYVGPSVRVRIPRPSLLPVPLTVSARIVDLQVRDGDGEPFPAGTAGVMACAPPGSDPCDDWRVAVDDDGNGSVRMVLDPSSTYRFTAFATHTGWDDPWISPGGVPFHFSASFDELGADVVEGTVLTVAPPAVGTLVFVTDPDGEPFAAGTAGVIACAPPGGDPCTDWRVAVDDDGDGDLRIDLDPDTTYELTGFATGTGWPGGWESPDGTVFHFSAPLVTLGSDLVAETTFVVLPGES